MPSSNTFDIKPIHDFVYRYVHDGLFSVDPFANMNRIASVTNDLDPDYDTNYNMDALDFLKTFNKESVDLVLFDPPYSSRQVSECYKKMGMTVNMETTQGSFWRKLKDEVNRITAVNGYVLCFGWNSNGMGLKRMYELKEILIVAHGGAHNDTICTAERKLTSSLF